MLVLERVALTVIAILVCLFFGRGSSEASRRFVGYDREVAVVIGISRYHRGWRALPNARVDAKRFAAAMRERGLSEKKGTLFTLFDEKADRKGIFKTFKRALKAAQGRPGQDRTLLVFYFAGHGESGYLIPYGSQGEEDYVAMSRLKNLSKPDNGIRHQLFLLSSCFSGSLFRSNHIKSDRYLTSYDSDAARWFSESLNRVARFGISAGTGDEKIPDGEKGQGSLFGQAVVRALGKAPGALFSDADLNGDGCVSQFELASFIHSYGRTEGINTPYGGALAPYDEQGIIAFCDRRMKPKPPIRDVGRRRGGSEFRADAKERKMNEARYLRGSAREEGSHDSSATAAGLLPSSGYWKATIDTTQMALEGGKIVPIQKTLPLTVIFESHREEAQGTFVGSLQTACSKGKLMQQELKSPLAGMSEFKWLLQCNSARCSGESMIVSGEMKRRDGKVFLDAKIAPMQMPKSEGCYLIYGTVRGEAN